jgi:hypothetical protein
MAFVHRVALALLVALTLSACGDTTEVEPPPPEISGSWAGIASAGFNNFWDLTLSLTEEASGRITGTARLEPVVPQQGLSAYDFQVRWGAYGYPAVLVALATPDRVDVNFSGEVVHHDSIDGLMNGSGFNNVPVTLIRQTPE